MIASVIARGVFNSLPTLHNPPKAVYAKIYLQLVRSRFLCSVGTRSDKSKDVFPA